MYSHSRLVYCLITDNSCSFGSIVPKALLSFVRVLIDIMDIDNHLLVFVIDYYIGVIVSLITGWSIVFHFVNMTGRAVGQWR